MKYQPVFFDIETTGLDPIDNPSWEDSTPNRVTCVGVGWFSDGWEDEEELDGDDIWTAVYMDEDEYDLIDRVLGRDGLIAETLDRKTGEYDTDEYGFVVGWNSRVFDHSYLAARAARYRISGYPIQSVAKRLDMMRPAAREYGNRNYVSEDDYLDFIGMENEDEFTGADMKEAFEDSRWRDIKTHCESDVEQMLRVFFEKREMMYGHLFDYYNIDSDPTFGEEVEF